MNLTRTFAVAMLIAGVAVAAHAQDAKPSPAAKPATKMHGKMDKKATAKKMGGKMSHGKMDKMHGKMDKAPATKKP